MFDQWLTISIVILLIALGAFFDRLLRWLERSRYPPPELRRALEEREGVLDERAEDIKLWLREGRRERILNEHLEGSGSLPELIGWLAKAPPQVKEEETLFGDERTRLTRRFWVVFGYLVFLGTVSGWLTLSITTVSVFAFLVAGLFGSCVAAFRSCLDRRANGFEDSYGNASPDPKTTRERFADGMITWFFGRPLLGAALGVATYLALRGEVFGESLSLRKLQDNPSKLMFYTFVVGLFAKTVLDLLLDLTKKIFPA